MKRINTNDSEFGIVTGYKWKRSVGEMGMILLRVFAYPCSLPEKSVGHFGDLRSSEDEGDNHTVETKHLKREG